jgi:hypothetical protein
MESIRDLLDRKNLALQQQGTIRLPSGDESLFVKALESPLIRDSSLEELKQVLRLVIMKIGLRAQNWPQDAEKSVLIEHIVSNFGGHRIEEIKLAFEMAIGRKLDLKTEEINCYENFSCAYFSTIMTAYRHWSEQAYKTGVKDAPLEQKIYTDEQIENEIRGDIEAFYQRCRKGITPYSLPDYFKPVLVKDGLMKEEERLAEFFTRKLGIGQQNLYIKNENNG